MKPFDEYPDQIQTFECKISNCRHRYGNEFMKKTGQTKCAYCGKVDFTNSYDAWLTMTIDHVVPTSVCNDMNIRQEFHQNFSNIVLACATCNSLDNRYKPSKGIIRKIDNVNDFREFRDNVFEERRERIIRKRMDEYDYFETKPWLKP